MAIQQGVATFLVAAKPDGSGDTSTTLRLSWTASSESSAALEPSRKISDRMQDSGRLNMKMETQFPALDCKSFWNLLRSQAAWQLLV